MEVSLYYGIVWRKRLCALLSVFPVYHGNSGDDHGICRGKGQQKEYYQELYETGETRCKVAPARLSGNGGKLSSDDVLYNGGRLDAVLFLSDAYRKVYRQEPGAGGRHVSGHALGASCTYGFHGGGSGGGDSDLFHGPSKRGGADHKDYDEPSACDHCGAGRSRPDP